jgi:hypothetical protein
MVTGGIRSAPRHDNIRYLLNCRRKFPLQKTTPLNEIGIEYNKLKYYIDIQAPDINRQAKALWISMDTWKLIDSRTAKSKAHSFAPGERQQLSRRIKRALNRDRKQRTKQAGEDIEHKLQEGHLKAAWNVVQKWYKHAGDCPPRPTRLDLQIVTDDYKELYRATPLTNQPLNVQLPPYTVDNDIPNHHEIATAVRGL